MNQESTSNQCLNCKHWRTMQRSKDNPSKLELTWWATQGFGECDNTHKGHYTPRKHTCDDFAIAESHVIERRKSEFAQLEVQRSYSLESV